MSGAGRPKALLVVSDDERATLERWARGDPKRSARKNPERRARGDLERRAGEAPERSARGDLERRVRASTAPALALRSKILLACAEGAANQDVAARLGVTPQMVGKWRARFAAGGLAGLADEPRSGRPRKITDEQVTEVILKTLEDAPPGRETHWSTRSMARATGLNQTAISRIWRAFGLKPQVHMAWNASRPTTSPQWPNAAQAGRARPRNGHGGPL